MGVFRSSKVISICLRDLAPIAESVMSHFREQGYEVVGQRTIQQGWDISMHKGEIFQAVVGTKTALKVQIETIGANTRVEAGVGIFGEQAIPTAISMLVFWPVLLSQMWGMIKQSKLDEEALDTVERALIASSVRNEQKANVNVAFCHECGAALTESQIFCSMCGVRL